jgi:hypothetical protein
MKFHLLNFSALSVAVLRSLTLLYSCGIPSDTSDGFYLHVASILKLNGGRIRLVAPWRNRNITFDICVTRECFINAYIRVFCYCGCVWCHSVKGAGQNKLTLLWIVKNWWYGTLIGECLMLSQIGRNLSYAVEKVPLGSNKSWKDI